MQRDRGHPAGKPRTRRETIAFVPDSSGSISGSSALAEFVNQLARWDRLEGAVAHRRALPAEGARIAPAGDLPPALQRVVDRLGIRGLNTHQAEAIGHARAGRDVAVVTPTASGKSLVFYLSRSSS